MPLIQERLAAYPALSAVRVFEGCRAAGYAGSYSQAHLSVRLGPATGRIDA